MLQRPTNPNANRNPVPSQGQKPQKEALEEGHHSTPRTGHPANPTSKSWRHTCHTEQAGQPLYLSEATSQSTLHTLLPWDRRDGKPLQHSNDTTATMSATAEPSDAHPAAPTHGGQVHRPNTTARHTAEDRTQQWAPKAKTMYKAHTILMRPTSPPKTMSPVKVHPREKKTHSIHVQEDARPPYPCQKQPHKKTHTKAHKRKEPTVPKPKPTKKPRPVHPEINSGRPAHPNQAEPSDPPPPDRTGTRHQRLTPPHPLPQIFRPTSRVHSLKERAPAMRWYLPAQRD
ncbi:hypothetical protein CRENBAI_019536 [Crenichthys baileyi]|uniref:Uncharacterized protein n=1 Tax=Crenichthys baileyi TaxID=28760 RepID=A0AAV9R2S7_9TELE